MRYKHIPKELQELSQWVCAYNHTKVPMMANENTAASSTNPNTWSDYHTAVSAVENGVYDHIGFVFADNGIVGIDIDTGYDEDGLLTQEAADIIGRCGSYTEKSKSGRGFHIILKGDIPFKGRNNLKGIEIYKASRYFIVTGDVLVFDTIVSNQSAIDYVVGKYFPTSRESDNTPQLNRIYRPVWDEVVHNNRRRIRPTYPPITQGSRNLSLASLAGAMHNIGYTKQQIYDEISHVNKVACNPPVSTSELQAICNSITKYKR